MRPFIVVVVFGMLLSGAETAAAQTQSDWEILEALATRMSDYVVDLAEFGKASISDSLEYEVTHAISDIAEGVADDLTAVISLLVVFDLISSAPDRLAVRPFIARQLTYYAQRVERKLPVLSAALARTQKPGLAALANSLRDDLRSVQQMLEGITLR